LRAPKTKKLISSWTRLPSLIEICQCTLEFIVVTDIYTQTRVTAIPASPRRTGYNIIMLNSPIFRTNQN